MWDVLRHPTYRRLFIAQVVALVGTGLLTIALGLLAYDIAGSDAGAVLGTALAIKMVAYVGVAPVVTALTERFSRKRVMVSADLIRGSIAVLLPFVSDVWHIYVLIFLLQAASATFTPTFQAVIPVVLERKDDYTKGLSLSRLAYDLESVTSPILAAALLTVVSYNQVFLATSVGFALSAILVMSSRLPRPSLHDQPRQSLVERITKGARVMLQRPQLRGLLALNLVVAAATGVVVVNTVVYVRGMLGGSEAGVAIALATYGAGSMIVALAMPRLLTIGTDRRVMISGAAVVPIGIALLCVLIATDPAPGLGWVLLILTWATLGAATSLINTPSARLLREFSSDSNRPAVFTAQFSLSHACFLLTYPIAGWVGAGLGQLTAALVLACLATLAAITAATLWPAHTESDVLAEAER
ncbi:MFS transporter [Gordonia sp. IITR100]|uniref:MFS transporter n=1 Tax=Gordonia sp. IITR100 TaxID=1314686 RepID=UPI000990F146|nr:MFS transporter [Gordonia sp. IITR100]